MPRIPRAQARTNSPVANMPNLVGDGWTAPGRATQQLGQSIGQLGRAFASLAGEADQQAEREQQHLQSLDMLKYKNGWDASEINAQATFTGKSDEYVPSRTSAFESHYSKFAEKWASHPNPKLRNRAQYFLESERGTATTAATRFSRHRYEGEMYSGTVSALTGQISVMRTPEAAAIYKENPELFEIGLRAKLAEANAIIEKMPANETTKDRLRAHAADELEKVLQSALPSVSIKAIRSKIEEFGTPRAGKPQTGVPGPQSSVSGTPLNPGIFESGKRKRAAYGWAATNSTWSRLDPYQKAAAMSLMEADGRDKDAARNALGAMINRAAKGGEDLGHHVSGKIYQPTWEKAQERRLGSIINSPEFKELTDWARRRAAGQESDPVNGATHFLARESTMLALERQNPSKYRSWRKWTKFNEKTGYAGVIKRDRSHAFLAPEGAYSYGGNVSRETVGEQRPTALVPDTEKSGRGDNRIPTRVAQSGQQMNDAGPQPGATLRPSVESHLVKRWESRLPALEKAYRAEVAGKIKELDANADKGILPDIKTQAHMMWHLAELGDEQLAAAYQGVLTRGRVNAQFKLAPPHVIDTILADANYKIATQGASPEMVNRRDALQRLRKSMIEGLRNDPRKWAEDAGMPGMAPLPPLTHETYSPQLLSAMKEQSDQLTAHYGDQFRRYFSQEQRDFLKARFSVGGPQLIEDMGTFVASFGDDAEKALGEISKDAPAAVMLGWAVNSKLNTSTIKDLARGIELTQQEGFKSVLPSQDQVTAEFNKIAGSALANHDADMRNRIMTAAKLIYETRALGKLVLDPKTPDWPLFEQAVKEAMGENVDERTKTVYGGIATGKGFFSNTWQNNRVILPPHIRQNAMPDILESLTRTDLYGALPVGPGGLNATDPFKDAEPTKDPGQEEQLDWASRTARDAPLTKLIRSMFGADASPDSAFQIEARPGMPEIAISQAMTSTLAMGSVAPNVGVPQGQVSDAEAWAEGAPEAAAMSNRLYGDVASLPAPVTGARMMSVPITRDGKPITLGFLRSRAKFLTAGEGKYYVSANDPHGSDPQFVMDAARPGEPWVFDLSQFELSLRTRNESIYRPD